MRKTVPFLFIFSLIWLMPNQALPQMISTAETIGVVSSGQTPFWLQSNRYGRVAGNGSHLLTRFQLHSRTNPAENIILRYGADLIARPGTESTLTFNQAYLKVNAYGFELSAGRFHNKSPIHDDAAGMGSLGVSGNATPVPQVRLALADWTALPFTNEFIKIRAHIAHGWLGSRRFTDDVLFHEKVGHARFGGDFALNLYGGVAHYAVWGGTNNPRFGDMPSSLSDFARVFVVVGGDENAPYGEEAYMLGDHKGAWDFGFFLELDNLSVTGYRQFPLETKNNLKFKSAQDALTGVSFLFDENSPVRRLTYEFLYTKWQNGPLLENTDPEGRDEFMGNENYYNHTIYQTGWVYNGRTIGNPLFIPRPDNAGVYENITNNRIVAHHLGLTAVTGSVSFTGRATFSRNYGTRINPFDTHRNQWSFGAGIDAPIRLADKDLNLLFEVGWDRGALIGNQAGVLAGVRWVL
ncbi:MAG: capsule assembly Wzi family protein [Balneolaceae bacterium]